MQKTTARYQGKRDQLLGVAARVFAEKGYHRASMRDIARAAESSLSGLYYYFPTKEEILYEVSARAFDTVLAGASAGERVGRSPEDRLRHFVRNHLDYFVKHLTEMRVLSHESDSLSGEFRRRIHERKRSYVALANEIISTLPGANGGRAPQTSALALFGMMNWTYTWYRPDDGGEDTGGSPPPGRGSEADVDLIATTMSELFLGGFARAEEAVSSLVGASEMNSEKG
jgi:AcrR family transcriptional regulator